MLNLLNGRFGIGAIAGPALVGWLGPDRYPEVFIGAGVFCVLIMFTLGGVATRVPTPVPSTSVTPGGARVLPVIAAFIGVYVLHVAIETGVGGWEPTHLETVGYGIATAATATSAYWAAMTIGRFVVVPRSLRFSAPTILTVCCLGMAAMLLLATVPGIAPYAYFAVALAIAPIFPTCLPWLYRAVPSVAAAGRVRHGRVDDRPRGFPAPPRCGHRRSQRQGIAGRALRARRRLRGTRPVAAQKRA